MDFASFGVFSSAILASSIYFTVEKTNLGSLFGVLPASPL
jgi:hypothetical protein